jgi:hypothetical protein
VQCQSYILETANVGEFKVCFVALCGHFDILGIHTCAERLFAVSAAVMSIRSERLTKSLLSTWLCMQAQNVGVASRVYQANQDVGVLPAFCPAHRYLGHGNGVSGRYMMALCSVDDGGLYVPNSERLHRTNTQHLCLCGWTVSEEFHYSEA